MALLIEKLLEDLKLNLYSSTKEELYPFELKNGLLNYGLFPNKVPPCFVSDGLANLIDKNEVLSKVLEESDNKKLKKSLDKYHHDYIRYEAMRETNIPRNIGIPHPEAYAIQVLAIEKTWGEISKHCNKPNPNFSRVYVRRLNNGRVFEMNYKGSERYNHESDEVEWMTGAQFIAKADIASCFPSIYTHSIPWALNGKEQAKKSSDLKLSGNLLDKCTQNIRDKQTNGLLIGPHTSNVISEIILTAIDCDLQKKGYNRVIRHIDDYVFYAKTYADAEKFIKDLGLLLRSYEMSLNEKKTVILPLPRANLESWIHELNYFSFPQNEKITFSVVRAFLDLALKLSQEMGKFTPLNYAIKILAGNKEPKNFNERAKKLYIQEAINLAILYPYLTPLLDKHVFDRYRCDDTGSRIKKFAEILIELGLKKIHPDVICHALYYTLKYDLHLDIDDEILIDIIRLDDCLSNTLLFHYAKKHNKKLLLREIKKKAAELKSIEERREQDKQWLFIYYLWSKSDLDGQGQTFLAKLKAVNFNFISFDEIDENCIEIADL